MCRREGISPTLYYRRSWTLLDSGKNGLTRDTLRDASSGEVRQLKEENAGLKRAVAELTLDGGFLPIRGHSNVQGVGSVGFAPEWNRAFAEKMESAYGLRDAGPGLDTYGSMEAAFEGKMRVAVLLGGNLYGSNPDITWAGHALRRVGTIAHQTTKLNPGHVHGRGRFIVLLPVLARDEEHQRTTQESLFHFVRLSDGGNPPPKGEIKSKVEVVCALAARPLPPGPFPFERMADHRAIRGAIADLPSGNLAMYSPEANRLVPRRVDPPSGTPVFKSVPARIDVHGRVPLEFSRTTGA